MKKIFLLSGFFVFIILQSCSSDKKEEATTESTEQIPVLPDVTTTDTVQPQPATQTIEIPAGQQPAQSAPDPVIPVSTTTGMNPAHGQPGHRCDIAVGAPLNSPPGKNNTPAPAPTTIDAQPSSAPTNLTMPVPGATQTIQASPPAGPTPPGMNPPHGQPGHDCSIAVGAPLKK